MEMIATWAEDHGRHFLVYEYMTYAYEQVELSGDTSRQSNFKKIGREATGIYRLVTEFDSLMTMPTEFQRITDLTFAAISNTLAFIDETLIVTHVLKAEFIKVNEVLRKLGEAIIVLNWENALSRHE